MTIKPFIAIMPMKKHHSRSNDLLFTYVLLDGYLGFSYQG